MRSTTNKMRLEEGGGREIQTWFLRSLNDQVVNHHAREAIRSGKDEWWAFQDSQSGVDPSDDALCCCFFVSRCACYAKMKIRSEWRVGN